MACRRWAGCWTWLECGPFLYPLTSANPDSIAYHKYTAGQIGSHRATRSENYRQCKWRKCHGKWILIFLSGWYCSLAITQGQTGSPPEYRVCLDTTGSGADDSACSTLSPKTKHYFQSHLAGGLGCGFLYLHVYVFGEEAIEKRRPSIFSSSPDQTQPWILTFSHPHTHGPSADVYPHFAWNLQSIWACGFKATLVKLLRPFL